MGDPTARLSLTGRRWIWPLPLDAPRDPAPVPPWAHALLLRRGVVGTTALDQYLSPSLATLDDPGSMADMPAAVDVLLRALDEQKLITVYGDYDVDGVSSTAVLVEFLGAVGARVRYYIPDRRAEGYGLNEAAVRELCKDGGVLVTTDCGVTATHEIGVARSLGAEVVVVDHHKVPDPLPPASAVLDPHRPDCAFPFKGLCATGVAFMLAVALRRALRDRGAFKTRPEPDVRELLDVVAVATVADMVPLVGLNRILVAAGLKRMAQSQRLGLLALLEVSKVSRERVSATDLGFRVAPRINARGRLAHAAEAVELWLTKDATRARELAHALDTANGERKEIEQRTVAAAMLRVASEGLEGHAGLVLHDPEWHPGVLGLVASRLVGAFHRPAIVIGEGGKGSGRTIAGLDLFAAIDSAKVHLVRFGGHAAAAGVTITQDKVPAFREAFTSAVEAQLGRPPFVGELRPDLEVSTDVLRLELVDVLEKLGPFGQENPEPLFVARNVAIREKRKIGEDHLKLRLGPGAHDAIGFGMARFFDALPEAVDVAFKLERNIYQGRESLQLKLEDLRLGE